MNFFWYFNLICLFFIYIMIINGYFNVYGRVFLFVRKFGVVERDVKRLLLLLDVLKIFYWFVMFNVLNYFVGKKNIWMILINSL